jgi:outer membrane protein assembly factor BamB
MPALALCPEAELTTSAAAVLIRRLIWTSVWNPIRSAATMKVHWLSHRLLLLSAFSILILQAGASDWPQWRGPQRNGHSAEKGLLQDWPKEGPKLLWQVNDIGSGYSTPSIAAGQMYLLSNEGLEKEFALALSTKDGRRLWSAPIGKVGHPEQNPTYPGSRSTPTVDGTRLYALGSDGDLVCLNTSDGKEHWRKNLRIDFGGKYGEWAYAESPLVDGDALICTPGGSNATMVALNKITGAVIWKCAMPEADDASYASMLLAEFSGIKQYVQFLAKGLAGVDAKTGKLLWRYARTAKGSPAVVMTPLISDGCIYTGAFRGGAALIRPVQKSGAFVVEEVYFNNKLPFGLGSVIKVGDYFYGSGQSLMCIDFKTGAIKWEERSKGLSCLAADGRLFAHADDGAVLLIEPGQEAYRERSRFTPPNRPDGHNDSSALTHPVLVDRRLYIRELSSLWCYDVAAQ